MGTKFSAQTKWFYTWSMIAAWLIYVICLTGKDSGIQVAFPACLACILLQSSVRRPLVFRKSKDSSYTKDTS